MIRSFKDTEGREWTLRIDVNAIRKLRAIGVDFNELAAEGLARLKTDFVLLCDVLYLLCKDQADRRNVTDEDFGRGLAGDVIASATEALILAVVDFFPHEKVRTTLLRADRLERKARDELLTRQTRKVEELEAKDPTTLVELLQSARVSSASTPEPGPSVS